MNLEDQSDANESVDTSPAGTPDAPPATDANPAESSPVDEKDANRSTEEVIADLLQEEDPAPTESGDGNSSDPEPESDSKSEPDKAESQSDEAVSEGEDEEKLPPFHEHPAWKRQIEKREKAERERDTLRPQAEEYARIEQFVRSNDLTTDEVAQGYQVMAALKKDPIRALEMLKPIVDDLAKQTGSVVPEDLQQKVEDGLIDADAAQRLAQAEAQKRLLEQQMSQQQESYQRRQQEAAILEMQNEASRWEAEVRSKDPDFGSKQQLVEYAARSINAAKPPSTAVDARRNLEEAYAQVNASVKGMMPKPAPVNTPQPTDSSTNNGSSASSGPMSTQQVIERVLAGAAV